MNRRDFIRSTTLASAAITTAPFIHVHAQTRKMKTALIGSGWWGMNILRYAMASGRSTVTALCDVDQRHLDGAAEEVQKLSGDRPKKYTDYRELLQKERPELVIVATPDHWHALIAIEAVKQGAHVYVEKPIGHTILEGRAMVEAARAADRVVQVGLHRHISPHNVEGIKFLQSGKAGKIGMVRSFVHYGFRPSKPIKEEEPPQWLDWDMYCGPSDLVPYHSGIHPRGFRQYLQFANGQLGDWGVHWFDQILWWTEEKHPKKVFSVANKYFRGDQADAPDAQIVTYEFESFTATWEHRLFADNRSENHSIGVYFYGTEGVFHMGWQDGWTFYPSDRKKEIIHMAPVLHTQDYHNIPELWADFMKAIDQKKKPVADIETGHYATNMSLLGMLSWKLGKSIEWDGVKEQVQGDEEANRLLKRAYREPWAYPTV